MAEAKDTTGLIYQNLVDAGCDKAATGQCMAFAAQGHYEKMLPILARQRVVLLGAVRVGQKKLDCLDFLIYKIKQEQL